MRSPPTPRRFRSGCGCFDCSSCGLRRMSRRGAGFRRTSCQIVVICARAAGYCRCCVVMFVVFCDYSCAVPFCAISPHSSSLSIGLVGASTPRCPLPSRPPSPHQWAVAVRLGRPLRLRPPAENPRLAWWPPVPSTVCLLLAGWICFRCWRVLANLTRRERVYGQFTITWETVSFRARKLVFRALARKPLLFLCAFFSTKPVF